MIVVAVVLAAVVVSVVVAAVVVAVVVVPPLHLENYHRDSRPDRSSASWPLHHRPYSRAPPPPCQPLLPSTHDRCESSSSLSQLFLAA